MMECMTLPGPSTSKNTSLSPDRLTYIEQHAGTSNAIAVRYEEAQSIRSFIPSLEDELDTLDKQIAILEARRNVRRSRLHRLRVATAPHKKLPVELLHKIFSYCTSECIRIPFDIAPNQAPWSLRHVSSHWRRIALGHHQLWRSVRVLCRYRMECLPNLSDSEPWGSRLALARQILPPVGPVSIALATQEEGMPLAQADVREGLVELVSHYVTRLQGLSLDCPLWGFSAFLRLPPTYLQNVQRLVLDGTLYHEDDPSLGYDGLMRNTGVLSQANNLRVLEVRGEADLLEAVASQQVPWSQLTELTFEYVNYNRMSTGGPTWDQFLPILRQCTSLERCSIKLTKSGTHQHYTEFTRAVLPQLQTLSLRTPDAHALDALTLPSLSRLAVAVGKTFPVDGILSLIKRSSCSLLSLKDQPITAQDPITSLAFEKLLEGLPTLKELSTFTSLSAQEIRAIPFTKLLPCIEMLHFRSVAMPVEVAETFQETCSSQSQSARVGQRKIHINVSTMVKYPSVQDMLQEMATPEAQRLQEQAYERSCRQKTEDLSLTLLHQYGLHLAFELHYDIFSRHLLY